MLLCHYRCLAKEMTAGPARQEVSSLANTHFQTWIHEISTYINSFMEDLTALATVLPYAEQSVFVGNSFLTLFGPTMDALLGNNNSPIQGGISVADFSPPGGCSAAAAAPAVPAARRSILKGATNPLVMFAPALPAQSDGLPPSATMPPPVLTSQYPAWPAYPPYGYGAPQAQYPSRRLRLRPTSPRPSTLPPRRRRPGPSGLRTTGACSPGAGLRREQC